MPTTGRRRGCERVERARAPMRRAAASIVMAPLALTGEVVGRAAPDPPDLKEVSAERKPGELFWVIKNGIKMTGMPSFRRRRG